jgi:pilus assembly protein CpaF
VLTDIRFGSERHLLSVVQKIVSIVGRRIDEASPMVDARMPDGSRFNAIIPPLALDGCLVSIRKFKKQKMDLGAYVRSGSMSEAMSRFLGICGSIRLNVIISGGTGSGKTTLLNALSGTIDLGERVVTIEDAAELQLQQPHVLRMETRPPNIEGAGEITQRHLVKNALRMRPDRIILGEIRGDEVIDMLSAMNTGHDGSMGTIHANSPRDAISRIENLVGMSAVSISMSSLRQQIASAVHLVIQIARQRDGKRRITQIDEVVGIEDGQILLQTLFIFRPGPLDDSGILTGHYHCTGVEPRFLAQAAYFGKEAEMRDCLRPG